MSQQLPTAPSFNASSGNHNPGHGTPAAAAAQFNGGAFQRPQVYSGGRQGAKPYQEDSYFSWISPTNRVIVGGIFDGHGGYNGLLASNTARDASLAYLQQRANECETWTTDRWKSELNGLFTHLHNTIRQAFVTNYANPSAPAPSNAFTNAKPPAEQRHIDERGIVRNANGDPIHGGSTATLVVMVKDANGAGATLITANVGDSTGFLVPTRGTWDFLSVDHGPENQDEWARINTSMEESHLYQTKLLFVYDKTNVFRKYECPSVFLPDGTKDQQYVANPWGYGLHPTNVRYEPAVYAVTPRHISKDSTCIAMCRALGDYYAHQFGLTHVPSISVKKISCEDSTSSDTTQNHTDSFATQEQAFTIFVASDGVWDCFTEDHQLLTEEGFMFVDELLEREKSQSLPRFASYNPNTKAMEYQNLAPGPDGRFIYIKKGNTHQVVDFESADSNISLTVTAGHDMFAQTSDSDAAPQSFRKLKAKELVQQSQAFHLLTSMTGGMKNHSKLPSIFNLDSDSKVDAFLQLYGIWLQEGVGSISESSMDFQVESETQLQQLQSCCVLLNLDFTVESSLLSVRSQLLVPYFAGHYLGSSAVDDAIPSHSQDSEFVSQEQKQLSWNRAHQLSQLSTKWLCWWAADCLNQHQLQTLLAALASSATSPLTHGTITTSSVYFRDQLQLACMRAGYSADFKLVSSQWRISFTSEASASSPQLLPSLHLKERTLEGRVWCVNVPPHHLIVARRAQIDNSKLAPQSLPLYSTASNESRMRPAVVSASMPVLTGNCWRYDDLHQFINDELVKRNKNLLEMGEAVLEESISRAITNFGAKHYDDACLVVWQFTPTRPKKGEAAPATAAATASASSSSASAPTTTADGTPMSS